MAHGATSEDSSHGSEFVTDSVTQSVTVSCDIVVILAVRCKIASPLQSAWAHSAMAAGGLTYQEELEEDDDMELGEKEESSETKSFKSDTDQKRDTPRYPSRHDAIADPSSRAPSP